MSIKRYTKLRAGMRKSFTYMTNCIKQFVIVGAVFQSMMPVINWIRRYYFRWHLSNVYI